MGKIDNSRKGKNINVSGGGSVHIGDDSEHHHGMSSYDRRAYDEKIEKVDDRLSDLERKQKRQWRPCKTFYVLLAIAIGSIFFISTFIILGIRYDFEISNEGIILTFVGIIAAFVVINNHIQVHQAKQDFEKKATNLESDFKEKIDDVRRHLESVIKNGIKDSECKSLSWIYSEFAMTQSGEGKRLEAFSSFVYAIGYWHDANIIDSGVVNGIIDAFNHFLDKSIGGITVDEIVNSKRPINGYALNCCLKSLGRIDNDKKGKITSFINELKRKNAAMIDYYNFNEFEI